MAIAIEAIRDAIAETLEGQLGTIVVTAGAFHRGVFDGQEVPGQQAKLIQTEVATHWFDVQLGAHSTHPASSVSTNGSRRLVQMPVRITVKSHLKTQPQDSERDSILAAVASDCEDAAQALGYPHAIDQTVDGRPTYIVGGLVTGANFAGPPSWQLLEENWGNKWIRHEIAGNIIINVPRAGIGWYVDSVSGDDDNDGRSYLRPFQTLEHLQDQDIASGDFIHLARDSVFREELIDLPQGVTIRQYGQGASRPVIDGRDIAVNANFVAVGGGTPNVYSISWVHTFDADGGESEHRVWEEDEMLFRAADLADCNSTPGSFWADTPTDGGPDTIYVHPTGSGNAITNGLEYAITARRFCVDLRAHENHATIRDLELIGNSHASGPLSYDGAAYDCIARDGRVHSVFAIGICEDVQAIGMEQGENSPTATMFISYMDTTYASPTGRNTIYRRCTADAETVATSVSGFFAHTDGIRMFGTIYYEDCDSIGCDAPYSGIQADNFVYYRCLYTDALGAYQAHGNDATVVLGGQGTIRTGANNNGAAFSYSTGSTLPLFIGWGHRCYKIGTGQGPVRMDIAGTSIIQRCTFVTAGDGINRLRGDGHDATWRRNIATGVSPICMQLAQAGEQIQALDADDNVYFSTQAGTPSMQTLFGGTTDHTSMTTWRAQLVTYALGGDTDTSSLGVDPEIVDAASGDFTIGNADVVALGAGAELDERNDPELQELLEQYTTGLET